MGDLLPIPMRELAESRENVVSVFSNFIGGEAVAASKAVRNINPSNTDDVIGAVLIAAVLLWLALAPK